AATWIPPRNRLRCARQPTLDDIALSGSKIPALRGNDRRLGAGQFDPIAEASELPDHSGRPVSLRLLAQGWASFLVPDALVQDHPDQAAQPVGDQADRLRVPEPRHIAAIEELWSCPGFVDGEGLSAKPCP